MCKASCTENSWTRGPSRRPGHQTARLQIREGPRRPAVLVTLSFKCLVIFCGGVGLCLSSSLEFGNQASGVGVPTRELPPKQRDGRVTAQGQEDEEFGWNQDSDPPPFDSSRCDLYSNTDFPPHLVTLKICKEEAGKKPAFEGTCRSNPCCSRVSCKQEANPLGPEHHLKETSIFFDVSLRCSFWLC